MATNKVVIEFMADAMTMVGTLAYTFPNGNMLVMCSDREGKRSIWEIPATAESQRFSVRVRGKEENGVST